jgi:hypothetical protein
MSKRTILWFTVVSLALLMSVGPVLAVETVSTKDAAKYVGKTVTVAGAVASALCTNEKGKSSYINLDQPYPNDPFVVRIAGEDCSKMDQAIFKKGTKINVTGEVNLTEKTKKPYIVVNDPAQIKIEKQ